MGRRVNNSQHVRLVKKTKEIYNLLEDGFIEIVEDSDFRKQKTLGEVLGYERIRTTRITKGERRRNKREKKKYSSKSRMNNNQHPLSDKRFKKNGGGKKKHYDNKAKSSNEVIQDNTGEN